MKPFVTFLGAGNMASAIARSLLTNPSPRYEICLYDTDRSKYRPFAAEPVLLAKNLKEALSFGKLIFLAVKPQHLPGLLTEIATSNIDLTGKTFISIAAGISIAKLTEKLGDIAIVRAMPNTPLLVGAGVTALCANSLTDEDAYRQVEAIFAAAGQVIHLEEAKMNQIIAVTSSSPAYVFLFIKAIADAAAADGFSDLSPEVLWRLVADVVSGSCKLLTESGKSPDDLIQMVTSPGGTTEQANRVLKEKGFCQIIADAMAACTRKAQIMQNSDSRNSQSKS